MTLTERRGGGYGNDLMTEDMRALVHRLGFERIRVVGRDISINVAAYSSPGGMRAGFELYRAWEKDGQDNQLYLAKKVPMPLVVLGGEMSVSGPLMESMMNGVADRGQFRLVRNAGHWLCEQNPQEFNDQLGAFLPKIEVF